MGTILGAAKNALADVETACSANADLGAIYNGWSLHESTPGLAQAIERFGQAADSSQKSTGEFYQHLEEKFVEPLQEQQQLAEMVAKVLKWRSQKQIEYEDATKSLDSAKLQLEALETSEKEAQRLQAVLNRHLDPDISTPSAPAPVAEEPAPTERPPTPPTESFPPSTTISPSRRTVPTSPYDPAHPIHQSDVLLPPRTNAFSTGGLISSLNSFLDNDPESTRRNTISRLREKILTLTEKASQLGNEIELSNAAIQRDLDRYQRDKLVDWRRLMLDMAKTMKAWSEQELETWKSAAAQFE